MDRAGCKVRSLALRDISPVVLYGYVIRGVRGVRKGCALEEIFLVSNFRKLPDVQVIEDENDALEGGATTVQWRLIDSFRAEKDCFVDGIIPRLTAVQRDFWDREGLNLRMP